MYQRLMSWAARHFGAAADKVLHAVAGALVLIVAFVATSSMPVALASALVVAVAKELHDHARREAGFHADPLDVLATMAGAAAVAFLIDLHGLPRPEIGP